MSKLDKKRDFATVYGVATHRFEQDGKKFDQEGNQVGENAPMEQQAGSQINFTPGPSKAEIDKMIADAADKARAEGIAQGRKEAEDAIKASGNPDPPSGEILVIDKDLNDYTSKGEVVAALTEVKEKYLPDLNWDGRGSRDDLKVVLADAIELVKGSQA